MCVSLTEEGRWRRRYLALYPICDEDNTISDVRTNTIRDINRPQILIFPRQSAKMATARIRLTSSHGIQSDTGTSYGHDKEEDWKNLTAHEDHLLTFKLIKRDKVTLYMKVGKIISNSKIFYY